MQTSEATAGAAALLAVAALGALNLHYPFVADQAVALLAARALEAGGTLYVDFWDNKMPGLFWFYWLAGRWFGFDEFGVHLLELLWMLGFALTLWLCLRRNFVFPWAAALVPVAVVGTYYVAADPFHLTQVEGLAGWPIFLAAWLAATRPADTRARQAVALLSGVCAGIAVVFKLVFAPLFVAFWAVASVHRWLQHHDRPLAVLLELWLPAAIGVGAVLAAVALRFWLDGNLWELYWTAFVYPPQALASSPPAPWLRLAGATVFFAAFVAVWAGFIALAWAEWWHGARDVLTSLMTVWLFVGLALILIQRFSWWPYHFLALLAPTGVLGIRGACAVPRTWLRQRRIERRAADALVLVLVAPALLSLGVPASQKLAAHMEVLFEREADVSALRAFVNPEYARIAQSVRFLSLDSARPGPIYVMGDPLHYHLSGRRPALPIIGWPWHYFLQVQWVHLPRQLGEALPAYLYIDKDARRLIDVRQSGVWEFVRENYVPFTTDAKGVWYQVRPAVWDARHGSGRAASG